MKKKIISVLLALSLAAGYIFTVPVFAEKPAYSGGSGTQEDPYLISTTEDMWKLTEYCNSASKYERIYANNYFKMTGDIDLGCSESKQWMPIGSHERYKFFSGSFDGDGHTITGLYIDNDANYQALFGCTENCTVQNLSVEGTVKGYSHVGGIVAIGMLGITMYNCSFKGTVYANESNAGGIAADSSGLRNAANLVNCTNEATVTAKNGCAGGIIASGDCNVIGCKNTGDVKGNDDVGGIGGYVKSSYNDGIASDCYNAGTITGTGSRIGGIFGTCELKTVTKSYNIGDVAGGNRVGGIIGEHGYDCTVSLCFNAGNINSSFYSGGIVGRMYPGGVINNCYNLGDVTAATGEAGGIAGFYSPYLWGGNPGNTRIESVYNTGKVSAGEHANGIIGRSDRNFITNGISLNGACSGNLYNTVVTEEELANKSTYSSWKDFDSVWQLTDGMGRPIFKNPKEIVEISTIDELCELSDAVNKGYTCKMLYIELTDDIDASGVDWKPIGSYNNTNEENSKPFLGCFNGNGHTILNLNVDAESEDYQGLFGYVGPEGAVRNITLDRTCFIGGGEHIAGIAALNAGTIENCKNFAEVNGDEYTGGIVGENIKTEKHTGIVKKCYNGGAINSGANNVGGIAGFNLEANISECANDGSVEAASSFAGGIVGQNHTGTVTNCLNSGEIRALRAYSGGVIGQNLGKGAKVSNCYNYGRVYSYEISGGVAGSNMNESVIEHCYYLEGAAAGGISGENISKTSEDVKDSAEKLSEEKFKNQSSFSGWDFNKIWIMVDRPYLDCAFVFKLAGIGTENNPYRISKAEDFDNLRLMVNVGKLKKGTHFLMTDDIDLANKSFEPIISFDGVLDGGEHTLSGFNLQYDSSRKYYGLFSDLSGTVKNLRIEGNIDMVSTDTANSTNIGSIAGTSSGTVKNCSFKGTINRNLQGHFIYMGGLVGYNSGGTIQDCSFEGELHANPQNEPNRDGGIVGINHNGTVSRCSNFGTIDGGDRVGGIAGDCIADKADLICVFENCHNNGDVSCKSVSGSAGGIVGVAKQENENTKVEIRSCYNAGKVSDGNGNGIIGSVLNNYKPTVSNCYCMEGSAAAETGAVIKKDAQFADGEVAYLLQNGNIDIVWGQTMKDGSADEYPILTTDQNKRVYKITCATKSNPNYTATYGTAEGVRVIPLYSAEDFGGWSLTNPESGKVLTKTTPVTSDITVYAALQEMYGGTDDDKTIKIEYGKGAAIDLSKYIVYKNGSDTAGEYQYQINSGNDTLNASVSGDMLTVPESAPTGAHTLSITAVEKKPHLSLLSVSFGNQPVRMDITIIVGKLNAEISAPKSNELTYNGVAQELITAGKTTGGTLMYSLDGEKYSKDIPKGTNAGSYTVYYMVNGGDDFNDSEPQTVNVTISQKKAELAVPTPEAAVYETKLSDIILPEGWKWNEKNSQILPSVNNNGYEAVYTIADYTNYDWSAVLGYDNTTHTVSRIIKPTIIKATPVVTPPVGKNLNATGEEQELIFAGKTTGGTLVYSLDGKNYSADIPKAKEKGDYIVYYKVIGDDNYNGIEAQTVLAKNGNKEIPSDSITYPKANKNIYNGTAKELISAGKTIESTKFLYSLDNKTFSEELPTAVDAGTYKVYYKIDGGAQYSDVPVREINAVITKQNPMGYVFDKLSELYGKLEIQNPVYGIKLSELELSDGFEWVDGSIVPEVDYAKENGYPAIMHIPDDKNYDWNGVEGYDSEKHIVSADLAFLLGKANITDISKPEAKDLTYTGNMQELVTRGSAAGGRYEYSLSGTDYSDTVPTGADAGEYTVYYRVVGDSNHKDIAPETIKVNIKKKIPEISIPQNLMPVVYGTELSAISLPEGWSWIDGSTVPTVNNNGYPAKTTITPNPDYDWNSIEGYDAETNTLTKMLEVRVNKAVSTEKTPEGIKGTYGNVLSDITLPKGWAWDDASQSVGNAGMHLFAAFYTPEDTDNYEGISANIPVEVGKTAPLVTAPEAKDIIYNGLAQELVTEADTTGGTVLYSVDQVNYFTFIPKGKNAGDYTVYYKVQGDGNYNDSEEQTIQVTIKKATLNLSLAMSDWTIGDAVPEPVISGNTSGGSVIYEYKARNASDSEYSADKPTDSGEYTVRATVAETANYNSASATADFNVLTPEGAPVANILTYNGSEQALVTADNENFEFSLDNITYSHEIPKAVNAGTYTVYYKIENSSVQTIDVTIMRAALEFDAPLTDGSYVYGKHLYEIALPEGWTWENADIVPDVNNAGYEAVFDITNDEDPERYKNYEWSNVEGYDEESLTVKRTVNVNIEKADMIVTLPRVKMLTYTGLAQELITAGSVNGGQILYSLNGSDFTTNVPTGVDAMTYTVYYKAVADSNHTGEASGNLKVTIFPKDVEFTEPILESVIYGTKLSEIPLPNGWEWVNKEAVPTVINSGYEATYKVTSDANYVWDKVDGYDSAEGTVTRKIPVTVNKARTITDAPKPCVVSYGSKLSDIELDDRWKWKDGETSVGNVGTHAFTAVYVHADSENYETVERDITVTVNKAPAKISKPTANELVYNGTNQELIAAPEAEGGTILYSLDGENYTTALPSAKNAGEYMVYCKVKGDENHLDTEPETVTAVIKKADLHIEVFMLGWSVKEEPTDPIVYGNTGQGKVTYEYKLQGSDDATYSGTLPKDQGVYTIRATAAETNNYKSGTAKSDFVVLPEYISQEYLMAFIGDTLMVTVPSSGQCTVVFAAYKNGTLQKVTGEDVVCESKKLNSFMLPKQMKESDADEIRAMLWSSLADMRPMSNWAVWTNHK